MTTYYWTHKTDGEIFDADFDTREEAQADADERFAEQCDGEVAQDSQEIELIHYFYNEDGERAVWNNIKSTVDYSFYHGDLAEHGIRG